MTRNQMEKAWMSASLRVHLKMFRKNFLYYEYKGRILFFGGLPKNKDEIKAHSNLLHYKELKLCGSTRCSVNQCKKIYEMVKEGQLSLRI
ncbi:MAG: hypothetical protein ACLSD7_01180 [Coprococcus phoceensis]